MSRVVGQNSLTLQGNSNFLLARDVVVHLETAAKCSWRQANFTVFLFLSWGLPLPLCSFNIEGLGETKITVSLRADHLVLIATLF